MIELKRDGIIDRGDMKIIIKKEKEYQSCEEDIYATDRFFFKSYRQAAGCVEEIIKQSRPYGMRDPYDLEESDEYINSRLLGYPSNVVAFCADRGQGKTSAMISFAQALDALKKGENQEKWYQLCGKDSLAPSCRFEVLKSIDPASMSEKDSIIKVVLSRIFSHFQDEWDRQCSGRYGTNDSLLCKRRTILQCLQKCYRNLQVKESGDRDEYDDDILEQIMEQGDSGNMRGSLYRLICAFLEFFHENTNSYLVLQIDDADLSLGGAYKLIDEIRRNLVMPRVIILLAANMFQLESTVEQHFLQQYQVSITLKGMVDGEQCHNIAARYMDKVIPGARQVHLPVLSKELASEFDHITVYYIDENGTNILGNDEGIHYQDQLLRFLHSRTGLVLLNPQNHLHNLLPGNMRELAHFLPYFQQLPELKGIGYGEVIHCFTHRDGIDRPGIQVWLDNLEWLERYLLEVWAPANLRTNGHEFLRSLVRYGDNNIHRHVLNFLPDYYAKERHDSGIVRGISVLQQTEYRRQFIKRCLARGIKCYEAYTEDSIVECEYGTYADVMEALNIFTELPGAQHHYKFIYAIRLYYTIRLHQLLLERCIDRNKSISLLKFLGDVLWRRDEENTKPISVYYKHYPLSAKKLADRLEKRYKKGPLSKEILTIISAFCRYKYQERRSCMMVASEFGDFYKKYKLEKRDIPDKELWFHVFYPCLNAIEMLEKRTGVAQRQYIQGAMILLLNWDVQYILNREYRSNRRYADNIDETSEEDEMLSYNIRTAYKNVPMEMTFKNIRNSTGEKWDEHFFDYINGLVEVDETDSQILTAIQLCTPELSCDLIKYYKKQIKEATNAIQGISAATQRQADTVSTLLEKTSDDNKDIGKTDYTLVIMNQYRDSLRKYADIEKALNAYGYKLPGLQRRRKSTEILDDDPTPNELFVRINACQQALDQMERENIYEMQAIGKRSREEDAEKMQPRVEANETCKSEDLSQLLAQLKEIFSNAVIVKVDPTKEKEDKTQ